MEIQQFIVECVSHFILQKQQRISLICVFATFLEFENFIL